MPRKPGPVKPLCKWRRKLVADNMPLILFTFGQIKAERPWLDDQDLKDDLTFALCSAARCFDPKRGFRFSTYACKSMWNHASRTGKRWRRPLAPLIDDNLLDSSSVERRTSTENAEHIRRLLAQIESPRMRQIVEARYGVLTGKRRTLQSVADEFGVTKERIRQLCNQAAAAMLAIDEGASQ